MGVRQNDTVGSEARMTESFEPRPEEKGSLVPPNRRPPTAIGVKTPPPPPPHPHRRIRSMPARFNPFYIVPTLFLAGGAAAVLFAPWILVRVIGAILGASGLLYWLLALWVYSGVEAWLSLRKESRKIRERQRELARSARPSA